MRTMACVWLFVIVLIAVQEVYGNICNTDLLSCDDCIRCGGTWCNEKGSVHCALQTSDDWCPDHQESLHQMDEVSMPGDLVSPIYAVRTLAIDVPDYIDIYYTPRHKQKAQIAIVNSTQNYNIELKEDVKCDGLNCTSTIQAKATQEFCSANGGTTEFVYVTVKVGNLDEVVRLQYHVPCACNCSQVVEKQSKHCNGHGDYSCGVCSCYSEWKGYDCSKPDCGNKRGDVSCTSTINDLECSGNGYCGPCDTCVCYQDREGSQYFDSQNYCADLCMIVGTCDDCLANNTLGACDSCINPDKITYKTKYNESLVNEKDEYNRAVWMKCNETINGCTYSYVAKQDSDGNIVVMVIQSCNDSTAGGQTATQEVSIILGVVALLAVVAAAAGIMIWKHMTALPPPPLNNPGYQNIDAEDCTGMNPLYKPPTTNFQNPTYGKW